MLMTYVDIIEAYKLNNTCHQTVILYKEFLNFSHGLVYTYRVVWSLHSTMSSDDKLFSYLTILLTMLWIGKNVFLYVNLCSIYEKFYLAVNDVQLQCILLITSKGQSDERKRMCKNVQRVNRTVFCKMRACRIFTVDGKLPLKQMSLLSTYIIVLLQFAFL
ncbi:uncharacterized protein LOC131854247 [Achroia grisella]|uniref:uncharacterized protein LOC131854247 n=1 Tax=Achroia grisella TaxID=688607 RepID=UPI0027D29CC3|nr:uncharacterized protein LOC131854247 [Achroia grisella]